MQVILEADGLSGDQETEHIIARVMQKAFNLFKERHAKYGAGNIARIGLHGVLSRALFDKGTRLERWMQKPQEFSDESFLDTILDIAVYMCIAYTLYKGLWPQFTLTHKTWSPEDV